MRQSCIEQSFQLRTGGLFLFLLYFLGPSGIYGQATQQITFKNWTQQDGLPNNSVNAVTRDPRGFLWLGTNNGLCRYDGPGVLKVYRNSASPDAAQSQSNGLRANFIRSLICDHEGNLWIGTRFGGLTRFNPAQNTWKTFMHNPNQDNSISNNEVLTILEDSRHRIWAGTEDGLNLFDPATSSFIRFT
ncbi:MAG: two-component regulator propeller domain-containing protein, partial [Bacteroidota bacterium]